MTIYKVQRILNTSNNKEVISDSDYDFILNNTPDNIKKDKQLIDRMFKTVDFLKENLEVKNMRKFKTLVLKAITAQLNSDGLSTFVTGFRGFLFILDAEPGNDSMKQRISLIKELLFVALQLNKISIQTVDMSFLRKDLPQKIDGSKLCQFILEMDNFDEWMSLFNKLTDQE